MTNEMESAASTAASATSYTGAGVSVIGGLMLNEVAMIVGMVVGVVGLLVNVYFKHRMLHATEAALAEQRVHAREIHAAKMRQYDEDRTDPAA